MYGGIRLAVSTSDGITTNTCLVGQPFIVEVIIDGVQGSVPAPEIQGIEQFVSRRSGMYMSSINGVSTTKYTYQVRIDHPGSYTIGPARLIHNQQEMISDSVSITVSSDLQQSPSKNNKKTKSQSNVFLRLQVESDRVLVGQKITGSLRFYYRDQSLTLAHLSQPDVLGFDKEEMGKPLGGTEEINGVRYNYAEWKWNMYPTKPGEYVIPAYSIDYELPAHDKRSMGSFFMFMNIRPDRKRVYSNASTIIVEPLPPYKETITAIGSFKSITAEISPAVAKKGEGMVMALEIIGDGNTHVITAPILQLPEGLKYYDSNAIEYEPKTADELPKKRFEFIVQGIRAGDWEIPEQLFTYFDIDKRTYVTLRTSPLSVSIQPSPDKSSHISQTPFLEERQKEDTIINPLAALNTSGLWYPVARYSPMSWHVFFMLIIVPLLYCLYYYMSTNQLYSYLLPESVRKKLLCRTLKKKIYDLHKRKKYELLRGYWIQFFAELYYKPTALLLITDIEHYMILHGMQEYEVQQWRLFFERVSCAAYTLSLNDDNHNELYKESLQWINRLEQLA